jgi:signal transduction histidine kinase/ligand-binding sensor domain-containing protein
MERADRNRRAAIGTLAKLCATIMLLACSPRAFALNPSLDINQYAHTAWTIREGFFKGTIYSIAQTPDGYLWLGTEFGLLRFDGVRSIPWQPPESQHLPGGLIAGLLAARDGRLWIGTLQGLASWKDGKLTQYAELAGQAVKALLEDREGTIWAGGLAPRGRLCAIRIGNVQCYGEDGELGIGVFSLYEDRGGNLWAGTESGLWRWKPGTPKRYPMPGPTALVDDQNGALWMAMHGGIRRLVEGKAVPHRLSGAWRSLNPVSLHRDRDGGLWIGTNGQGLLHVHQGGTDLFAQSDGLSSDVIEALFEDREGNVWAATRNGLDRFRDIAVPTVSARQGLSNATVTSVLAARDGSVWLGTADGLNRWSNEHNTIYRKRNSGLPDDYVGSLFQDNRERIWVSTRRGVAYFENGRFIRLGDLQAGEVHSIAGDSDGNVWISHQDQGVFHFLGGRVVERISSANLGSKDMATNLLPDPVRGGLWIGYFQGGVTYFKGGQLRASYVASEGLGKGRVTGLQLDRDGTLWATTQGGLSRVKDGSVATLTSKNGLPCDTVHWMMEDDAHAFWLSTACGLVNIARADLDVWATDPKRTVQVTVFDSSDGVRGQAVGTGYNPSVAKSADGKLWFLPSDGVSVIDPRHLPFNKLPPPVHVEEVKVDGNPWDASHGWRLPALTRELEIHYTALSLVAPEKNRFKYKLEGRDSDWKDAGNERKASYTDLPPRNYRFRVIASNNNGVWNEAGDSLEFSVAPAYYQTNWFRALIAAVFLAMLWALYRYRLHQIAREFNMRLDERVDERTRIARELHDTLLQSFQGLMLRLQAGVDQLPPGKAKDAIEKALERGDQAIAEGRDSIHDLRSSTIVGNDLAAAVAAIGDEMASADSATFRLVVEGSPRELHPILRDEIYRIAREAVRNAFLHARARQIEAEITYGDRLLRLRVRDDGRGMDPAMLEEGRPGHYGLPGMRERASRIGAQLNVWSAIGAGTEVELILPGAIAWGTALDRSWWHSIWPARRKNTD